MEVSMWDQVKQAFYQSTAKFLTGFASLLPGVVALIVALLISIIVAWILSVMLRRVLAGMRFDQRFPSIGALSPELSPTLLAVRTVSLIVIITGLLVGLSAFSDESASISLFVHSVLGYIPNILGAVLVLLVGNTIARFLARTVLIGAVNMNLQYARLLSAGVKWLVIVLSVAMALEHLRIAPGIVELAFGILFGGIVFSLALAVGLGSRELVSKSLEHQDSKRDTGAGIEEPFRHV
jgi:hypothetical protein